MFGREEEPPRNEAVRDGASQADSSEGVTASVEAEVRTMKAKWGGIAACLVLGLAPWSQVGGLAQGYPLTDLGPGKSVVTDAQGWFFAEFTEPVPLGVRGRLSGPQGAPLAGHEVTVVLEPRAGIARIVGIGTIGAVWLAVAGYEPARIAGFFVGTADGGRPLFEVGSVVLAEAKPCSPGAWKLTLRADWESSVDFVAQQCSTNPHGSPRWATWLAATAPKHTALPESPGPRCTWVVVTDRRGNLIVYTFYHSDGTAWQSRGTVEIGVAAVRPAACQVCTYVRVGGTDDMQVTYHCDATGKWVQIGIWGLPAPPPPPPPPPIPIP